MSSAFDDVISSSSNSCSAFDDVLNESNYSIDDFEIRDVDYHRGRDFIKEYHYSGGCGTAVMLWGCFHSATDELLGVIAFQTPISENTRNYIFGDRECNCLDTHLRDYHGWTGEGDPQYKPEPCEWAVEDHKWKQHVTELHRLAIKPECPQNTASWLIENGLRELKKYKPKYRAVISFADTTEGHDGTIYQATNAIYYGMTDESTFYRDQDGRLRNPRQCGENITLEKAEDRGWTPEKRESKHRYLYLLPDPYQSREDLRDELDVEPQAYPDPIIES